jgi:hypothetical protein
MRVLVACEYSGRVRDAFAALGHDAWSCDLLPTDSPGNHIQGDVLGVINDSWDLMIAHPPCTYLCSSGMHWTTRGKRDPQLTEDALDLVRRLLDAPIPRIALENPIGCISSRIRKPDQIVQPWWFGDDASKKTCLWLKGLPLLRVSVEHLSVLVPPSGWKTVRCAMDMVECDDCGEPFCLVCDDHYADCECIGPTQDDATYKTVDGVLFATLEDPAPRMIWGNQTPSGQNKLGPSADRWKLRSVTYEGIANAMATQWGQA